MDHIVLGDRNATDVSWATSIDYVAVFKAVGRPFPEAAPWRAQGQILAPGV